MRAPLVLLLLLGVLPVLAGVSVAGPELVPPGEGGAGLVLGVAGQDADLRCTVLRLGDKSVSWVRSRDLQILSHAGAVFTADSRVSASTDRTSTTSSTSASVHSLHIARLRPDDAGRYECQLNTEPKTSLLFDLRVLEHAAPVPVVMATGGAREVRTDAGHAATLACEARYDPATPGEALPPLQIRWTRSGDALDATGGRGGVSMEAERWVGGARSSLTLADVSAADAGLYWCSVGEARAELLLRVLNSVQGAAAEPMQGDAALDSVSGDSTLPAHSLALALSCTLLALRVWGP